VWDAGPRPAFVEGSATGWRELHLDQFWSTRLGVFVEADFETYATVADLLSAALVSWRKALSFSILA
jgi:hypothetical protein